MKVVPIKSKKELEEECLAHIEAIRAYKRGEGEPDPGGMIAWAGNVAAHLQDYVRDMVCYNMTAPFVVAAMRMVADNLCEAYEKDTPGFTEIAEGVQQALQEVMGAVTIKVPDVEATENGEGGDS